MRNSDELYEELMQWPVEERLRFADRLLASAGKQDPEIETAWDEEVRKRVEDFRSGRDTGVPVEDFLGEIEERFEQ